MQFIVSKSFKTKRHIYQEGDTLEITDQDVINNLLNDGVIIPIKEAFENKFKAFSKWLLNYPLDMQDLKDYKPELYDRLMSLYNTIDKYWLKWNYQGFIEAIDSYKREHLAIIKEWQRCNW